MRFNYPGNKLGPAIGQDKIEHLSSYAHVVHTTAKKVISRHRKNENVFKMSKDEKMHVQSVQKQFFLFKYANFWGFCWRRCRGCLSSLVKRHAKKSLFLHTKYGNHSSIRSCNFRSTTAIRRSLRQRFLK